MILKKRLIAAAAVLFLVGTFFVAAVEAGGFARANSNGLTDIEEEGILFMREEEKLARDVYLTFYETYNDLPIFNNIAQSEQQHMNAVKTLIDKYGLEDPTEGKDVGEFTNQDLQDLYHNLISQGSTLIAALEVGAEIEEIDIIDLKDYISQTDKTDILWIYGNLLKGSKNHLRAFVKELKYRGVTYEPKHLSQEEFDDIIDDGNGRMQSRSGSQNQVSNSEQTKLRDRIRNMIENILGILKGERNIFRNRNWR